MQMQVRRWCAQLQSQWSVVCDALRDFSTAHVSYPRAGCIRMLGMLMCVERSIQLQSNLGQGSGAPVCDNLYGAGQHRC